MVDPIEIKLEEMEDVQLKTWADVQRLMRDFSKPETKKEMLAQLPDAKGGIIDTAINKLVGKVGGGSGGALGAGMAGGLAAGGVMALVQIIAEAISSSRILMTMLKLISTALGLLVDVILLPFLPILIMGILWLFRGIMLFHQLWSKIWNSTVIQSIKIWLEKLAGVIAGGLGAMILFSFAPLVGAASVAWAVLTWLYELYTLQNGIMSATIDFTFGLLGPVVEWLYYVFTGIATLAAIGIDFQLGIIGDLLKWLWDASINGIKIGMEFVNKAAEAVGGAVSGAASAVGGAAGTAGDWLSGLLSGGWLPTFADGGTVPGIGPQLVIAHGGEEVRKPGQSGGNNTFNFYGYDDNKLKGTVENILRREQYRYNV